MQYVTAVKLKSFSLQQKKTCGQSFHQYSSVKNFKAHNKLARTIFGFFSHKR